MAAGVDFLQLADGDFSVNRGRLQLLVTEQLLDVADVRAAFEHVRGAGVAEQVATAFQARRFHPVGGHAAEDVGVEGVAVAGEEQRGRARVETETRTHFLQVAFEPRDGARADGHDAVFLALAPPDGERAPLGVQVGEFEAAEFGAAQAAGVKQFEHRAIAHAERVGDVGHGNIRNANPQRACIGCGEFCAEVIVAPVRRLADVRAERILRK